MVSRDHLIPNFLPVNLRTLPNVLSFSLSLTAGQPGSTSHRQATLGVMTGVEVMASGLLHLQRLLVRRHHPYLSTSVPCPPCRLVSQPNRQAAGRSRMSYQSHWTTTMTTTMVRAAALVRQHRLPLRVGVGEEPLVAVPAPVVVWMAVWWRPLDVGGSLAGAHKCRRAGSDI